MKYRQYPFDPVLVRAGFRCEYCGRDLLADLDTFLTLCRDHVVPASAGGPNHNHNRVASCATCDRLKANTVVDGLAEARAEIAAQRATRAVWLDRIRDMVRRDKAGQGPAEAEAEICGGTRSTTKRTGSGKFTGT